LAVAAWSGASHRDSPRGSAASWLADRRGAPERCLRFTDGRRFIVSIVETEYTDHGTPDGVAGGQGDLPGPAGLELLQVDPRSLVIGVNVRADAALDKAFVGSIRDRGVREPIIVRRDGEGRLVVRKGQRRTLGAIQAGRDVVTVVVESETAADDDAARHVDRLIDQLGENQHRAGISVVDEVRAHQQLLELGLSAGQIARRTRTGVARVRATLAVAGSQAAAAAVGRHGLSLEQAAVIAEFDGNDLAGDAVKALIEAASARPGQFEHVAQRLRDARVEARLRAELTGQLAAAGVRVVQRPESRGPVRPLGELRAAPDSEPGTVLTGGEHAGCPGHVAWLENSWRSDQPLEVVYGCVDWARYGHAERYAGLGEAGGGRVAGPMSEEQKAERRTVIAHNRAWGSAARVRRVWLRQFLARRSAPKGAPGWIASVLAEGSHEVRRAMEDHHALACQLLGVGQEQAGSWYRGCGRPHPIAVAAAAATPARATMLTLGILLAALEAGTGQNSWRDPGPGTRAYLAALRGWGYELSDVEQLTQRGADPSFAGTQGAGDAGVTGQSDPDAIDGVPVGQSDPDGAV
jgi:ParB family transcriptional regulator, chromosome partitioning protein